MIPGPNVSDRGAGFLDGTDGLVPENATLLDLRDVALEDMQIGAADRHRVDPHDDVGIGSEVGIRHFFPAALPGTVRRRGLSWSFVCSFEVPFLAASPRVG